MPTYSNEYRTENRPPVPWHQMETLVDIRTQATIWTPTTGMRPVITGLDWSVTGATTMSLLIGLETVWTLTVGTNRQGWRIFVPPLGIPIGQNADQGMQLSLNPAMDVGYINVGGYDVQPIQT